LVGAGFESAGKFSTWALRRITAATCKDEIREKIFFIIRIYRVFLI
jgi:hypothetical protein